MRKVIFTLDHPNNIYHSGETLNCSIELRTDKVETIKGISITILGYVKVEWYETIRNNDIGAPKIQEHSGYQQYLDSVTYVLGSNNGQKFNLETGTYNYTFSCYLPPELPSSMQGDFGEIKYEVIFTMHRPFQVDYIHNKEFEVIKLIKFHSLFQIPKKVHNEEYPFYCCCQDSGNISAELSIPLGCYDRGQKIQYQMFVFNATERDMGTTTVKLEKCVTFESRSPSKRVIKKEIYSKTFPVIFRSTRKIFIDSIKLPPKTPQTTFDTQQLIKVEYLLSGEVKTGICASNVIVVIPIIISAEPIFATSTIPGNEITEQPTAPVIDANYSSLPYPTQQYAISKHPTDNENYEISKTQIKAEKIVSPTAPVSDANFSSLPSPTQQYDISEPPTYNEMYNISKTRNKTEKFDSPSAAAPIIDQNYDISAFPTIDQQYGFPSVPQLRKNCRISTYPNIDQHNTIVSNLSPDMSEEPISYEMPFPRKSSVTRILPTVPPLSKYKPSTSSANFYGYPFHDSSI